MANSPLPDLVLLEDANDLCDFYEVTHRTVRRTKWAIESIALVQAASLESMF